MSFDITDDDLALLECYRLDRYRLVTALPDSCAVYIDMNCDLNLHCHDPRTAQLLCDRVAELRDHAYLIFGAEILAIYNQNELLWSDETRAEIVLRLESEEIFEDAAMGPAATIDREAIEETVRAELNEVVNTQVDDVIRSEASKILADNAGLQARVRDRVFLLLGQTETTATSQTTNGAVATIEPELTQAANITKPTAPKRMKLPTIKALEKLVSNRYKMVLEQLIEPGDRETYLAAICAETQAGKEWTMKVSQAIFKKYGKPEPEKIYGYLLDNARKLQAI